MKRSATRSEQPEAVVVHIPLRVARRAGLKEMQLPEGATSPRRIDNTLAKAIASAFRWKRKLESGEFASAAELAERERIASSYMTRILRLSLLRPELIETILGGEQPPEVTLVQVLEPFPMKWSRQVFRVT